MEITERENFKRPHYNRRIDYRMLFKFFNDQRDGGFGTPSQEPKRINLVQTTVEEHSLFSFLEPLFRKVVREETECAISKLFNLSSSSSVSEAETTPAACSLQLLFHSKLPHKIFTNNPLKADDDNPLKIVLYDVNSKAVVDSGPLSSAKVDLVVISGLFARDQEDWTEEEFNSKILWEREGKRPLLAGNQSIVLKNGVGLISDLCITDNSSWIPNRKFILGAKLSPKNPQKQRVKPARSNSFSVKDIRGEGYTKHYPPTLQDQVWRLEKIRKDGKFHDLLTKHKIFTVGDFLLLNKMNQPKLRRILGRMSEKTWRKIMDHAETCIMDDRTVSEYPNGCDGPLVEDLNQPAYLNKFDEPPADKLALTYYRQAGPSIPSNFGFQPLEEPGIMHPQEHVQIQAPTTNPNSSEEYGTLEVFQIQTIPTDPAFPPTLQPDYVAEDYTFLPQTPFFFPPATFEHGNDLLPSPSYVAEAGVCSVFPPFLDHGADIVNGVD